MHSQVRTLALPLLVALLLAVASGAMIFRNRAEVFATPFTEDSFYSLAVARNVATGHGITADGEQPTNGFQPLFTVVEAGAYWVAGGDEILAGRLVLAASWLIYLATALLVGLIARDAVIEPGPERVWRFLLGALLYGGGFLTFMHHFNGLETGLALCLYAQLWRLHQTGRIERAGGPILFGVLLGLLVLARIDSAVFVALFTLWRFAKRLSDGLVPALREAALLAGIAFLISSPWWAYNFFEFGSLMPTSGTAQAEWALSERRLRWVGWALGVALMPTLWVGRLDEVFFDGLVPSLVRAAVLVGLVRLWWVQRQQRALPLIGPDTARFAWLLAAAVGLLAIYYGVGFIAYWFYYRYLFPAALLGAVGIAILTARLAQSRPLDAGLLLALLALPTLISALLAQGGHTLHVDTVYGEQLALVEAHVPAGDEVAAGQTGTLNYFRSGIVNVDGKVNRAAIPHQQAMWTYLDQRGVHWFADWHFYVEKYLGPDPTQHGWHLAATRGPWELWQRN